MKVYHEVHDNILHKRLIALSQSDQELAQQHKFGRGYVLDEYKDLIGKDFRERLDRNLKNKTTYEGDDWIFK